jgi:hypothetical protein
MSTDTQLVLLQTNQQALEAWDGREGQVPSVLKGNKSDTSVIRIDDDDDDCDGGGDILNKETLIRYDTGNQHSI